MAFRWILERELFTEKIELSPTVDVYTVGRGKENYIKCLSLYVSRRHCKIVRSSGNLAIVDLSSANGTFVNQTRILAEREIPLQEGDVIGVGVCDISDDRCFIFRLHRKSSQNSVNAGPPLPDSSTSEHEIVIITDSDSDNNVVENREAQAKEISRKRPAAQELEVKCKIQRLGNTTTNGVQSSDLNLTRVMSPPRSSDAVPERLSSRIEGEECDNDDNAELGRRVVNLARELSVISNQLSLGATNCANEKVKPVSMSSEANDRTRNSTEKNSDVVKSHNAHSHITAQSTLPEFKRRFDSKPTAGVLNSDSPFSLPCRSDGVNSGNTTVIHMPVKENTHMQEETELGRFDSEPTSRTLNCQSSLSESQQPDITSGNRTAIYFPVEEKTLRKEEVTVPPEDSAKTGVTEHVSVTKLSVRVEKPFVSNNLQSSVTTFTCKSNKQTNGHDKEAEFCDKRMESAQHSNRTQSSSADTSLIKEFNLAESTSEHKDGKQNPTDSASAFSERELLVENAECVSEHDNERVSPVDIMSLSDDLDEVNECLMFDNVKEVGCEKSKSEILISKDRNLKNSKNTAISNSKLEETPVIKESKEKTISSQKLLVPHGTDLSATVFNRKDKHLEERTLPHDSGKDDVYNSTTLKGKNVENVGKKKSKATEQNLNASSHSVHNCKEPSVTACEESKSLTKVNRGRACEQSDLQKDIPVISKEAVDNLDDSEDEFMLCPALLEDVLYGGRNKKSKIIEPLEEHNQKNTQEVDCEQIEKNKMSTNLSMSKDEPFLEEVLISDDEIVIKPNKIKPQRQRILSGSSTSSEGIELLKKSCRRKSQSTISPQSRGKRKLSLTSNSSDNESNGKRSTVCVDKFKKNDLMFDVSVQDSADSDFAFTKSRDEELLASMLKIKPVVKLERIDEKMLNSNSFCKEENDSLNYTLDEDIVIISDDDDDCFPSSQIFDEPKTSTQVDQNENQDEAPEDTSFNEVLEDDDIIFEDEDPDVECWFKRLSQQEPEPDAEPVTLPELPPETDENVGDLKTAAPETVSVPCSSVEDIIEKNIVADDMTSSLLKADKVKIRQKDVNSKPKGSGKVMLIDAPPMPRRRASHRVVSVEEETHKSKEKKDEESRMAKEKNELVQQLAKPKISSDSVSVKVHKPRKKGTSRRSRALDNQNNFTASQKKQIADQRKEKLKAISEKEKAAAAALRKESTKVPAEVKIKVTKKNRGAFLTEGAESTVGACEVQTNLSSAVKKLQLEKNETSLSKDVPKEDDIARKDVQQKKRESRSIPASSKSVKDLPRIPKISERPSTSKIVDLVVPACKNSSGMDSVENVIADMPMPPILTSAFSALPIIKALAPTINVKVKKTVRFKKDSELVDVRMIPVAENSRLLPVAHKKDAPTPRMVCNNQLLPKGPELEETLYDILSWNPKWLEEQRSKTASNPPPVHGGKLWPMLSSFLSYGDYLRVLTPLLLLELWTSITRESESNSSDPRKSAVVVGIDKVDATPRLTRNKKQLMHIECHAVLSEEAAQKQLHPRVGDLVYLELELENELPENQHMTESQTSTKQRRVVPIFAYVNNFTKEAVTGRTKVHKEILRHSKRPTTKIFLILLAKFRPYDVKVSNAMRIKVVSYIRSELRLFQAMAYLPSSPLCNHVLKPEEQDYTLPDLKQQKFVPLINQDMLNEPQRTAVLQTAHTCLKSQPKICMIQGPPGTGKSHVIVNLIIQILYGQKNYRRHGSRRNAPRILVCAPSNAAVDELVIRLLQIRQSIQKEDRFRMVRTGRQETMNPLVKDISVLELAKRDARNIAQSIEGVESVDLEIRNLEARRNSLMMALESARQKSMAGAVRENECKLGELERRLFQMRKSKTQNSSIDPRELWRLERDAQSRILLGADIVATTLSSCFNNQMENIFTPQTDGRERSHLQFTCCIVDEATQSQELETLIPLMLGVSTLVLVGDAKQLPATVLSKVAKENGLGRSLFARLQECFEDTVKNPVQFLGIQYRMHPDICQWPNRFFYNSRLHSAPNLAQQRICPVVPYCILSLDYKQNGNGELENTGEAELVSLLAIGILEKLGNQQLSLAIITPYHKQRSRISNILQSRSSIAQNVEVNTIDSFQGQERDIIVMSCVRTGGVGFLADTQRLNVALTRARHSCLLCGNFTSLRVGNENMWRALLENANQRNMLKHVPSSLAKNKDELLKLVLRDK